MESKESEQAEFAETSSEAPTEEKASKRRKIEETPERLEFWSNVASRIAEAREAVGMTQTDLGKKVGFTPASVCSIEKGRQRPGAFEIIRMADALGFPVGSFFPEITSRHEFETRLRTTAGRKDAAKIAEEIEGTKSVEDLVAENERLAKESLDPFDYHGSKVMQSIDAGAIMDSKLAIGASVFVPGLGEGAVVSSNIEGASFIPKDFSYLGAPIDADAFRVPRVGADLELVCRGCGEPLSKTDVEFGICGKCDKRQATEGEEFGAGPMKVSDVERAAGAACESCGKIQTEDAALFTIEGVGRVCQKCSEFYT